MTISGSGQREVGHRGVVWRSPKKPFPPLFKIRVSAIKLHSCTTTTTNMYKIGIKTTKLYFDSKIVFCMCIVYLCNLSYVHVYALMRLKAYGHCLLPKS